MTQRIHLDNLPNDHRGCGWYDLLPAPAPAVSLTGEQAADWVVLGGGFTGLAAARRLATLWPQARVVLIDAQRVGFGASGRNSGFMIDLPHDLNSHSYTGNQDADRRLIMLNRAAIAFMRELVQQHAIDCDWSELGKIHAAASDRGAEALSAFERGLDALGEPYTVLSANDLSRITGSDHYRTGLHTPGTILVQPAALTRALAGTMPENVEVYEDSPVINVSCNGNIGLECGHGTIATTHLLLTNNGFAVSFPGLRRRMIPIFTYASMTRPLTGEEQTRLGGDAAWGLIPADPLGTTVRRLSNNRILIRNSFTHNPRFASSDAARQTVRRRHEHSFKLRFPQLADVGFEYTWGGVLSLSRNSTPFFGRLMPGIFAAVCHNGLGVARGTIAGKLLAEYASGSENELVRHMLAYAHPARNPPEPILSLGVRGKIRWREWQAGAEL